MTILYAVCYAADLLLLLPCCSILTNEICDSLIEDDAEAQA